MYYTCGDRNQWIPSENNLSTSSLHRTSVSSNCAKHTQPVKKPSFRNSSLTSTPTKTPFARSQRYSTLPRARPPLRQSNSNLATIFRNDLQFNSQSSNSNIKQSLLRQNDQIPWQSTCQCIYRQQNLCPCRKHCYNCKKPTISESTSTNALGYNYPYPNSTLSLNQNYLEQQPTQHHHSMINLNQAANNCAFHNRNTPDDNMLDEQQENDREDSPALSNSPPPPAPPPPTVKGCNSKCIFSNMATPTLPRHNHSLMGSSSHLHASLSHQNSNYGIQPQESFPGKSIVEKYALKAHK